MAQAVSEYEGKVDGEGNADKASDDEKEDPPSLPGKNRAAMALLRIRALRKKINRPKPRKTAVTFHARGKRGRRIVWKKDTQFACPEGSGSRLRIMAFKPRFEYIVDRRDPMDAGTMRVFMSNPPCFMLFKELFNAAKLQ